MTFPERYSHISVVEKLRGRQRGLTMEGVAAFCAI